MILLENLWEKSGFKLELEASSPLHNQISAVLIHICSNSYLLQEVVKHLITCNTKFNNSSNKRLSRLILAISLLHSNSINHPSNNINNISRCNNSSNNKASLLKVHKDSSSEDTLVAITNKIQLQQCYPSISNSSNYTVVTVTIFITSQMCNMIKY